MSVRQGDRVAFHISNSRSYYDVFVFHVGSAAAIAGKTCRSITGNSRNRTVGNSYFAYTIIRDICNIYITIWVNRNTKAFTLRV